MREPERPISRTVFLSRAAVSNRHFFYRIPRPSFSYPPASPSGLESAQTADRRSLALERNALYPEPVCLSGDRS